MSVSSFHTMERQETDLKLSTAFLPVGAFKHSIVLFYFFKHSRFLLTVLQFSCNCFALLLCKGLSLLTYHLYTSSLPGSFQFGIFLLCLSTISVVIASPSCYVLVLLLFISFKHSASLTCYSFHSRCGLSIEAAPLKPLLISLKQSILFELIVPIYVHSFCYCH